MYLSNETCFVMVSINHVSVRYAISILLISNIAWSSVVLSLSAEFPKIWIFESRRDDSPMGGLCTLLFDAVWLLAGDEDKFGILPARLLIVVLGVFWLVVIPVGPTGFIRLAIAILLPGRCLGMFSKLPLVTGSMFTPGWLT